MSVSTFYGVPVDRLDQWDVQTALVDGVISDKLKSQIIKVFNDKETSPVVIDGAVKYDTGKSPLFQGVFNYFPKALEEVGLVSAFGASKYAWGGWRHVDEGFTRYTNAMLRHTAEESKGFTTDDESGFNHAAHVAWNALARLELLIAEQERGNKSD